MRKTKRAVRILVPLGGPRRLRRRYVRTFLSYSGSRRARAYDPSSRPRKTRKPRPMRVNRLFERYPRSLAQEKHLLSIRNIHRPLETLSVFVRQRRHAHLCSVHPLEAEQKMIKVSCLMRHHDALTPIGERVRRLGFPRCLWKIACHANERRGIEEPSSLHS
ncbi:hypothetical protein B0H12DRAFT_88410 [Mycena haematopus]|nr:hypothetical protein B0H12DRAFT_88410 [Mycena haematopus]